jgi:hypothetical protein
MSAMAKLALKMVDLMAIGDMLKSEQCYVINSKLGNKYAV